MPHRQFPKKDTVAYQLATGLEKRECLQLRSTTRYWVFLDRETRMVYYVGKNGTLRQSPEGKVTYSVVAPPSVRDAYLEAGRG